MSGEHEKRPGWLMARLLRLDAFFGTRAACWIVGFGNLYWFWVYKMFPDTVHPVFAWFAFGVAVGSFNQLLLRSDRAGR